MLYKKFELSQSLNGTQIVHIARNSAGAIIFRESTQDDLKKAIDAYYEDLRRAELQEQESTPINTEPTNTTETIISEPTTKKRTKKLITNSLQEQVQQRKSTSFWDKFK